MTLITKNPVEIGTASPNPVVIENAKFIKAPYDMVQFRINPESVQVSQQNISKLERVEGGYVKIGFDSGLITIAFSGKMPLFFGKNSPSSSYNPRQNFANAGDDFASVVSASEMLETSPSWRWFQEFSDFVRGNVKYPFYLSYYGIITQLGGVAPVLKGDITAPAYSQDAQNPFMINYNFSFSGVLVSSDHAKYMAAGGGPSTMNQNNIDRMKIADDFFG